MNKKKKTYIVLYQTGPIEAENEDEAIEIADRKAFYDLIINIQVVRVRKPK